MSAGADVIVLLSSPERAAPQTPGPPPHTPCHDPSPCGSQGSILSPSELCRLPMQSKYFQGEGHRENKNKRTTASETSSGGGISVGDTNKQKEKEPSHGPGDSSEIHESSMLERTVKGSKVATAVKKKRGKNTTSNKLIIGKVAKSASIGPTKCDKNANAVITPKSSTKPKSTKADDNWEKDGLLLEAAMKRRLDWTPTKDTLDKIEHTDGKGNKTLDSNGFGNLLSGYNFNGDTGVSCNDTEPIPNEGPTKRRRIDLVDSKNHSSGRPSNIDNIDGEPKTENKRGKSNEAKQNHKRRVKKLTTLTARVTAQYQSDHTNMDTESTVTTSGGEDITALKTKASKPKGKNKSKSKPQEPEIIILSPEEAVKSFNDQDFVFGTCSQLEREDSPTMLRDMQIAIRESEKHMPGNSIHARHGLLGREALSNSTISRFATPKNLWSVAARDLDGSVLEAEILDLTETPVSLGQSITDACDQSVIDEDSRQNNLIRYPQPEESVHRNGQMPVISIKNATKVDNKTAKVDNKTTGVDSNEHHAPSMPQYANLTDAQLSRQVADFGFKPLKGRRRMIELLQKCWESKNGSTTNSSGVKQLDKSTPRERPQDAEQKTPKAKQLPKPTHERSKVHGARRSTKPATSGQEAAKSRKASTRATQTSSQPAKRSSKPSYKSVEEIEDSEEETIPSPNRLQNSLRPDSPKGPASLPVTTTTSRSSGTTQPSEPNIAISTLPCLADQITKAVRAQPRFTSNKALKNLTWHERIVMYDPIIIEDFAAWLNTEGLSLVNEDREINTGFLRQWCQSRGICCCYRRTNKV